ncbi:MAG: amidohydrolase family protein [candidate division WOR-3 bacterium]
MIYCCESYLALTGNPYLVGRSGGADELVRLLDDAGIQAAMTLVSGADAATNRTVKEAMDKYPERIFGMCLVNPQRGKEAVDEFVMTVTEWGFRGLKHSAEIDDIVRAAAEMGIPVTIHTGGESWNPRTKAFYGKIAEMAKTFPDLPIIMEHMGYRYSIDLAIEITKQHPNLYLGTTIPAAAEPIVVKQAIQEVGAEKVVFGSNAPFALPDLGVEGIRRLKLSKEEEALVLAENFRKIYGIKN